MRCKAVDEEMVTQAHAILVRIRMEGMMMAYKGVGCISHLKGMS